MLVREGGVSRFVFEVQNSLLALPPSFNTNETTRFRQTARRRGFDTKRNDATTKGPTSTRAARRAALPGPRENAQADTHTDALTSP